MTLIKPDRTIACLMQQFAFVAVFVVMALFSPLYASDVSTARSSWISAISSDNTTTLTTLLNQWEKRPLSGDMPLWANTASNGKTALMVACKVGDTALAKRLVSLGADIRQLTVTEGTAFMFAVLGDQKPLAMWLLSLGADIDAQGSNGWTSVMIAAAKGLDDTLAWLLTEGADAQTPDVYGFSPLMRAADNRHAESVRLLLAQSDVDVHWQDEVENTALHYAVSAESVDITQQLLRAGADAMVLNRAGFSSMDLAQQAVADEHTTASQQAVRAQLLVLLRNTKESQ